MTTQPGRTVPAQADLPDIPAETVIRWHATIADDLRAAFEAVLPVGKYTLGAQLSSFEREFAAYSDAAYGIGISSGTAALHLGLRALGVGPGDEVITVPNTYVATVFAITYVGATPVFVDVDPITANMDARRVSAAITDRTKAIVPVHMYGQCVDIDAIRSAAPGIDDPGGCGPRARGDVPRAQGRQPRRARGVQLLPIEGARCAWRWRDADDQQCRAGCEGPSAPLHGPGGDQARTPGPGLSGAPRRASGRVPAGEAPWARGSDPRFGDGSRPDTGNGSRAHPWRRLRTT